MDRLNQGFQKCEALNYLYPVVTKSGLGRAQEHGRNTSLNILVMSHDKWQFANFRIISKGLRKHGSAFLVKRDFYFWFPNIISKTEEINSSLAHRSILLLE
jgi:hypothetical protein